MSQKNTGMYRGNGSFSINISASLVSKDSLIDAEIDCRGDRLFYQGNRLHFEEPRQALENPEKA
jgi:hypothetical protein